MHKIVFVISLRCLSYLFSLICYSGVVEMGNIAMSSRYDANVYVFFTGKTKTQGFGDEKGRAYQGPCFGLTNKMGTVCGKKREYRHVAIKFTPTNINPNQKYEECKNGIDCTGTVFIRA